MVRILRGNWITGENATYVEIGFNASEDTLPTDGIATGSLALDAKTGDIYSFDEESSSWTKIS